MKTRSKSVLFAIALVMFLAMTAFMGLTGGTNVAGVNIPKPFTDNKSVAGVNIPKPFTDGGEDGYAIAVGSVTPRP